jgi:hypothetical protein
MSKTDAELLEQHQKLSDELQTLLIQEGLLAVIQSFGLAAVGGSAALGLLVRRDVDVSVRLKDDMDTATFFAIGAAITKQFLVQKASYSNHFIRNWPGFDHGLYWGIQLKHQGVVWKLDLWGYGPAQFDAHRRRHVLLSQALAKIDRTVILRLKDDLHDGEGYRYGATGPDIYTAMTAGGVRDVDQFEQWWKANRAH